MARKLALTVHDLIVCDVFIFSFEGRFSCSQLIKKNAEGPYINPFVILTALNYLWRDIVDGAAESLSFAEYNNFY